MRAALALLLLALLPTAAGAERLGTLERQLAAQEARSARLGAEVARTQSALKDLQKQSVALAGAIQAREAELLEAERRMADLEAERAALRAEMGMARADAQRALTALARLRRTPPEALALRPNAPPIDAARSAMLLAGALAPLRAQAETLERQISALSALEASLAQSRAEAAKSARALRKKMGDLAALEQERKALLARLRDDHESAQAAAERVARQARDVRGLIARLAPKSGAPPPKPAPTMAGPARLPAQGVVALRYGQTDAMGAASQGLTIATQPGALAVAPQGGVVRFAGRFQDYGNMVIIDHGRERHSLVAGLGEITTVVGARLMPGEPLGTMPAGAGGGRLYYESRARGRPVDPAPDLKGARL